VYGRIDELIPSPAGERIAVRGSVPESLWTDRFSPVLQAAAQRSYSERSEAAGQAYRVLSQLQWGLRYAAVPRFLIVESSGRVHDITYALGHRPPVFSDVFNNRRQVRDDSWNPDPPWRQIGWFDEDTLALERVAFWRGRHHQLAYLDLSGDARPLVIFTSEDSS
jgi:hypothetical protein